MRILLSWVYWRRPEGERPQLLAEAERAQASVKRKGKIQAMAHELGPSFVDLAREDGRVQAHREILKTVLQDKFGRLPKKLQKQIDAVDDAEQLRQAIRRVLNCSSLPEFQL